MNTFNDIIQFILYPKFEGWLLVIKIIFLYFSVVFLWWIIWALINTSWLRRLFLQDLIEFLTFKPYGVEKFKKQWQKIKKRAEGGLEAELKLAIIEADSLLDEALERSGYQGESLGEKLNKVTTDILPSLEEIRKAHGIRNNIVHDPTYRIDPEEIKKYLAIYEKALIELQVI